MSIDGLLQGIRGVDQHQARVVGLHAVGLPLVADVCALTVALLVVRDARWLGIVFALLSLIAFGAIGAYAPKLSMYVSADVPRLVGSLAVPGLALASIRAGTPQSQALLRLVPVAAGLVIMARLLVGIFVRRARAGGLVLPESTLIVGSGQLGVDVARVLRDHAEYGLEPVGFVDSLDDCDLPLPHLGGIDQIDAVVREFGIRHVIVAWGGAREHELVPLLRGCEAAGVDVHVIPRLFDLGIPTDSVHCDEVWGVPMVRVRRSARRTRTWRVKRVIDIALAAAALVVAAPIMAVIAVAVCLSSPGPVLFRQQRIGERGRPVAVLKFRTMRVNSDADVRWSVARDTRVTRVGRLLRMTGLDELPQLVNILRGDMSLVGPRPERPHFFEQFAAAVPGYEDRVRVPPGLTGWAQVNGLRGDTSIEDRARFDNHYIEHWSLGRDLLIIGRTIGAVARRTVRRQH